VIRGIVFAAAAIALAVAPVFAADVEKAPPGGTFKKLSDLLKIAALMVYSTSIPRRCPRDPFVPMTVVQCRLSLVEEPHYHLFLWHVKKADEAHFAE
jgi:hypothetical protein